AALRRARVQRFLELWRAEPRLCTGTVRRLRVRAPRAFLLQAKGLLSELWGTAHGRAGSPPRGRRAAARPGPAMGPDAPVSPAQGLPRGARRLRSRGARVLPSPGATTACATGAAGP